MIAYNKYIFLTFSVLNFFPFWADIPPSGSRLRSPFNMDPYSDLDPKQLVLVPHSIGYWIVDMEGGIQH
jgi:hypothetical protein